MQLDEAETRIRFEALVETIRRDLECEPDSTRDAPCPQLPAGTSPTTRARDLERELRLMGPINPLALEEHTALQERHGFLEGQLDDVRSARRELGKVIRAVDAEIVEVFRAAYADVADNFEKLFATLFPADSGGCVSPTPTTCSIPASRSRPARRARTSAGCRCSRAASAA